MNLWMRWVSFQALRELVLIVKACPSKLRAIDLARIATEEGILLNRDREALGPSTHYHHRRTLERLGLLFRLDGRYVLNEEMPEIRGLTERESFGETLNETEKSAFGNVILRNRDCHDAFFHAFLQPGPPVRDVGEFLEQGRPIELRVSSEGAASARSSGPIRNSNAKRAKIVIRSSWTRQYSEFGGENARQAIHFGIRSWCVDQLGFMDSLYRVDTEYTIYPKSIVTCVTNRQLELEMLDSLKFDGEWATVRVGDFALDVGIRLRVAVDQAESVLQSWLDRHRDVVAGIATRERLISGGLTRNQRDLVLKGYLQEKSGAYVSHLQIHRSLRKKINEEVLSDAHRARATKAQTIGT